MRAPRIESHASAIGEERNCLDRQVNIRGYGYDGKSWNGGAIDRAASSWHQRVERAVIGLYSSVLRIHKVILMPRFLHTADWQIGRQYGRFSEEDAPFLFEARFHAVERIAALANDEKVDAVLVAGDVFDAQTVSERTIRRTFMAMANFDGLWLMISGNHDAALVESVWSRAQRLGVVPENVKLLLEPRVYLFEELGFAVLAAPLTQRQTHQDLTARFDQEETPEGLVRIGLAHGSVEGLLPDSVDSPNPIAHNRAQTARLDYLALGDWHGTKQVDAHTWYSGTPEQERFKNNEAGQVLLVNIDAPGAQPVVVKKVIGEFRWLKLDYQLNVETDLQNLLDELEELPENSVVDVSISGQIDLDGHQKLQQVLGAHEARHRSFQSDLSSLELQPTDDDIAALAADGYVGEVIAELREQQRQDDTACSQVARQALALLTGMLRDRRTNEESQT